MPRPRRSRALSHTARHAASVDPRGPARGVAARTTVAAVLALSTVGRPAGGWAQPAAARGGAAPASAPARAPALDAPTRAAVLAGLFGALEHYYVFPRVARTLRDSLHARDRAGAYATLADPVAFAAAVTRDLRRVGRDLHLELRYSPDPIPVPGPEADTSGPEVEDSATLVRHRAFGDRVNYGFPALTILPGNVGYLKLDGFFDLAVGGGETAAAAMTFVRHTRTLIVDLRENGGGNPNMGVLLSSYLFARPVRLSGFAVRDLRGGPDRITETWTLPAVPGPRYPRPVYVLTSRATISAGEGFAYDLQTRRRAVVVGEVTAGAANPGTERRVHAHFAAFIPFGRAVSLVTGTNWEGVGVRPDLAAPPAEALRVAHRDAVQRALRDEADAREAQRLRAVLADLERAPGTPERP